MVAAAIRTIFAQPDAAGRRASSSTRSPTSSAAVPGGGHDAASTPRPTSPRSPSFPRAHWRKVWSTNPIERLNREIKRRTDVVGIFPNEAAMLRLVGAVLIEAHDEWQVAERRYLSDASMAAIYAAAGPPAIPEERPALLAS